MEANVPALKLMEVSVPAISCGRYTTTKLWQLMFCGQIWVKFQTKKLKYSHKTPLEV